jgi:polysaccharide export outer membrane protein
MMGLSLSTRVFCFVLAAGTITASAQSGGPKDPNTALLSGGPTTYVASSADGRTKTADLVSQYTVGVADVLHVNVWKNTDLSQTVTVGPDGFVSLPLLGDVKVADMTTNQLSTLLTSRLTAYMVNPDVTVSVVEIHSRQVYLMGQVTKPGGFPLIGPMTVLQLIAQAGGLTPFAKRKSIYILRTANGHTEKLPFNYSDAVRGKGNDNVGLQPGDTVFVP